MVDFQFKKSGLIMGFGTLRYGNIGYPCMLHEAEINIYPIRMCKSIVSYPKQINGIWNIICAGELNGSKDACQVNNLYKAHLLTISFQTLINSCTFI